MTDRRYSEEEVRRIFEIAASTGETTRSPVAQPDGFTLHELKSIGQEAGLDPATVEAAAWRLTHQPVNSPRQEILGMPIGVGMVQGLPRDPTEDEWHRLVAHIRETFAATGKVTEEAGMRRWRNGNLNVFVEQSTEGPRLRMITRKSNAALGFTFLAAGLLMLALPFLGGGDTTSTGLVFLAIGLAFSGTNALQLRSWADERERQMEHLAAQAMAMLGPAPPELTDGR